MKVIISNTEFEFTIGCKILRLKYQECPSPELQEIWDGIPLATLPEIAAIPDIYQRRVAMNCMGIERLIQSVQPRLVNRKSITKKTMYTDQSGQLIQKEFTDTYELYEVDSGNFNPPSLWEFERRFGNMYFVKFRDTSTGKENVIWVSPESIYETNRNKKRRYRSIRDINAVQAIAWTITTDVPVGGIEKIVRQGDCILVKQRNHTPRGIFRHLTAKEYRTFLSAES